MHCLTIIEKCGHPISRFIDAGGQLTVTTVHAIKGLVCFVDFNRHR
jgi:hypothetical protein